VKRAALACMLLLLAGAAGCKKSEVTEEERAAKAAAAASAAAASHPAAADADAGADGGAGKAAGKTSAFTGKYTVSAGSMYVPAQKDWSAVKFKNDESKMLGDGEITLTIDPTGRVSGGTEAGPLGASVIDGASDGTTLTATIRRKDPTDEGLTGTLVAKIAGDALDGTMNLAESNAAVVRVAKVDAKKK
jgi:hypothetical protein